MCLAIKVPLRLNIFMSNLSYPLKFSWEEFILDYRKAMYWPSQKWLLLADVHWGKTHFFQKHGVAVGHQVFLKDLQNMADLIRDYNPEVLLCLGDLIHHEAALDSELIQDISRFRQKLPTPITLIRGNHERYVQELPESWGIDIVEHSLSKRGIHFVHEKEEHLSGPQVYGHLHPKLTLKAAGDYLSLPCFLTGPKEIVLPAFSAFTGGKSIDLKKNQTAYLCDEQEIAFYP